MIFGFEIAYLKENSGLSEIWISLTWNRSRNNLISFYLCYLCTRVSSEIKRLPVAQLVLDPFIKHNTIIDTLVGAFCSGDLKALCGDLDALVLKGHHNNDRTYVDPALTAYESLFVKGI